MKSVHVATNAKIFLFLLQSYQLFVEQWRLNRININKHCLPLIIRVTLCRGLPSLDPCFLLFYREGIKLGNLQSPFLLFHTVISVWWHSTRSSIIYNVGGGGLSTHSSSKRTWDDFNRRVENAKIRIFLPFTACYVFFCLVLFLYISSG